MWKHISSEDDLSRIINEESNVKPVVLFKHSTRCPVSFTAKKIFEHGWDNSSDAYLLDLIAHRNISNLIEKRMLHEVRDDDLYIIKLSQKINAYIISKDKFPKERETYPELNWDDINSRIRRDWVVDSTVFIDPDLNENKLPITDHSIDTTYTSWIEDKVLTKTIRTIYDCILEASGMIYDPSYPTQLNISEKKSKVRDELSWIQGRVDKEKDEIYIICPEDLGKFAIGERGEILYAATRLIRESLKLPHVVKISVEFME